MDVITLHRRDAVLYSGTQQQCGIYFETGRREYDGLAAQKTMLIKRDILLCLSHSVINAL